VVGETAGSIDADEKIVRQALDGPAERLRVVEGARNDQRALDADHRVLGAARRLGRLDAAFRDDARDRGYPGLQPGGQRHANCMRRALDGKPGLITVSVKQASSEGLTPCRVCDPPKPEEEPAAEEAG
jgi:hypothetical protein